MKQIYTLFIAILLSFNGCSSKVSLKHKADTTQDVQVYTAKNSDNTITPKSIEAAFEKVGLSVAGNNNMNIPFKARFTKIHHKIYNLAMYSNNELTYKLIRKYPKFGLLTPLTMSIYSDGDTINVSTLSISAMSRVVGIPKNDPDLIAYAELIDKALKTAMPRGHFKELHFTPQHKGARLNVSFIKNLDTDELANIDDFIDDFEAEFESELEPYGFLFPNFTNLQEDIFDDYDYHQYEFYHTYSICKFDVIYPVSKLHPEAGAWAPCSFYIYKRKGENKIHMGFLGVDNWITTLDIKDKESIEALKEAQGIIIKTLKEMTE